MHFFRIVGLALPVIALLLACSGKVETIGGKGPGNPGDDGGGDESIPLPSCPAPDQVGPNVQCSYPNQQCLSAQLASCDGGAGNIPVTCACLGGNWDCNTLPPQCIPTQDMCPAPNAVINLGYCSVDPSIFCQDTELVPYCDGGIQVQGLCQCLGNTWQCSVDAGVPVCPSEAGGGCPPPMDVNQGWTCFQQDQHCPGNPTFCAGSTLYDDFVCNSGVWIDDAMTICDVDAADAGPPDSAFGD